MLKKNVVLTFILSFGLFYLPIKVDALEIVVDNGMVTFYQDNVLGDDDDSRDEEDSADEVDEVKDEREKMTSRQRQLIRVKSSGEKTEVELRPTPSRKSTNPIPEVKEKLERIEQMESKRVSLEFETRERVGEMETTSDSDRAMLRARKENSEQELELESREVKARIKQGAEFELNSQTNEVTLITPSGQTHVLNHLPDQAIARMQEAGLFSDVDSDSDLVSITVNDDSEVIEYRQKVKKTKKFLGLFDRQVESEVILNDSTSEVYEEPASTGFQLFLDQLSF
ncbi:MAG: hypothetical protein GW945_00025 [Candidatus Pacebacteria bacterium]|nr:hypothetical protein [Candidatus Paceibacterota bacterium]